MGSVIEAFGGRRRTSRGPNESMLRKRRKKRSEERFRSSIEERIEIWLSQWGGRVRFKYKQPRALSGMDALLGQGRYEYARPKTSSYSRLGRTTRARGHPHGPDLVQENKWRQICDAGLANASSIG